MPKWAVGVGYLDANLDKDALDEHGYYRTGDLGVIDEDGYVVISGRLKDVIIRHGENISAKEVEDIPVQYNNSPYQDFAKARFFGNMLMMSRGHR